MGWLDLSLKNPHKIIDIEYQNPCNVCAALSFEGFQETREPSEDTPQSFRASFGFIWGSWTQSIQLSECNSKLKCCAFTKKNTIILMDVPLWDFFWLQRPKKKKTTGPWIFQCKGLTTKVMEIIFVPDFNPRKSPKKCRGHYITKPNQCTNFIGKTRQNPPLR